MSVSAALALRGRGNGEHRKSEKTESEGKSACIHTEYFTRNGTLLFSQVDFKGRLRSSVQLQSSTQMKPQSQHRYFYVDETGDPNFYAKGNKLIVGTEGCSRTFGLGFLRTIDPAPIRLALLELRNDIGRDRYLASIPSMRKTMVAFHAKNDCPEVRKAVFDCLDGLDFAIQIVVARKHAHIFDERHLRSQDAFYNELTSHLFERQLHLAKENTVLFARRNDKEKQHALRAAVENGVAAFRSRFPQAEATAINIETAYSADEPLLQAADYALWAVQRAFEHKEMRYFDFVAPKIEVVWDIYDFVSIQAGRTVMYTRHSEPFHIEKVSPLS